MLVALFKISFSEFPKNEDWSFRRGSVFIVGVIICIILQIFFPSKSEYLVQRIPMHLWIPLRLVKKINPVSCLKRGQRLESVCRHDWAQQHVIRSLASKHSESSHFQQEAGFAVQGFASRVIVKNHMHAEDVRRDEPLEDSRGEEPEHSKRGGGGNLHAKRQVRSGEAHNDRRSDRGQEARRHRQHLDSMHSCREETFIYQLRDRWRMVINFFVGIRSLFGRRIGVAVTKARGGETSWRVW